MPILRRTVLAFAEHAGIDQVTVVINPTHRDLYDAAVAGLKIDAPVDGGASRQDSVLNGLVALAAQPEPPTYVMIHDAARPLIASEVISNLLKELQTVDGCVAARRVVDTIKKCWDGAVTETVDRSNLWQAYTPQAFRFDKILAAHRYAVGANLTDDAAVAEKAGMRVTVVESNPDNIKITTPEDQEFAESRLANRPHATKQRRNACANANKFLWKL